MCAPRVAARPSHRRESLIARTSLWMSVLALVSVASSAHATWNPFHVCQVSGSQYGPQATTDGSNGAIVAWFDTRSTTAAIYAQHVLASDAVDPSWPVNGLPVGAADYFAAIVSDGAGGAIVAWSRNSGAQVVAHHVLASGVLDPAWPTNGVVVTTTPNDASPPVAVSDLAGGAIVAWVDNRNAVTTGTDVYAQRVRSTGVVDPAWPANGVAVCTSANDQADLAAAGDGGGGIIVAWDDLRNGTDLDIYAQRLLPTGVVASGWTAGGVQLESASDDQRSPRICSDGASGAIVAWSDIRNSSDYQIYVMRVRSNGGLGQGWAHGGEAVCTAAGDQEPFDIVADGSGGAVISWCDPRAGDGHTDIYAQRVTVSGTMSWTPNGVPVCTAANDQVSPSLGSDGSGGVYVAWQDRRHETTMFETELYLHHVLPTGSVDLTWPVNGGRVTFDGHLRFGGNFAQPVLSRGSGNAAVLWAGEANSGIEDVFALNLNSTWTPFYGLQVAALGPGSVTRSPDQSGYPANSIVTLTAAPQSGHTFLGWGGDASGSTNPLAVTMSASKSITAFFDGYPVNTMVSPPGSGSVARNPNQAVYLPGTQVMLTAQAVNLYGFANWSGDANGSNNPLTITVNGPMNITANFVPVPPGCGDWDLITSATLPSARVGAPLAWDPVRHRVLMFGGDDATGFLNDVWQFTTAQGWSQVIPAGTPPSARAYAGLVHDPVRDRLLVVSGDTQGQQGGPFHDVWQLTLSGTPTWSQVVTVGTAPEGSTIYDPIRDRVIVYASSSQVWSLSLAGTPTWTQLAPTGTPPQDRSGQVAIYDPVRDRMVIHGGSGSFMRTFGDTWALSLAGTPAWTPLASGPQATGAGAAYDPIRDRMLLVGGSTGIASPNDLVSSLTFDVQPVWMQVPVGGYALGARVGLGVVYDPDQDLLLAFFGNGPSGLLNDGKRLICAGGWWLQTGMASGTGTGHVNATPSRACYPNGQVVNLQAVGDARPSGGNWILCQWLGDASGSNPSIDVTMDANKTILAQFSDSPVGVAESPSEFALRSVQPNPTRGALRIDFSLTKEAVVRLRVYDLAGREVARLLDGSSTPGPHTVTWDGQRAGAPASSGVYLIRFETPQGTWSRRVALIR